MRMKAFRVQFGTENAAFEVAPRMTAARMLREIARRLETGEGSGSIRDENGNTVGAFGAVEEWS